MYMLMEHLPPCLETIFMASSGCFTSYPWDETVSTPSSDSDNVDRVDPGSLPSGMRSFLGHVYTYGSVALKQNTQIIGQTHG